MVMQVNTENNTYSRVTQKQWLIDRVELNAARAEEQQANFAGVTHHMLKGLPPSIDPDRQPKNFKDAMSREDKQEWGLSGLRHLPMNIADLWKGVHSKRFVPGQVLRFMTL
jgi:hypothetical protein